jgi:hypothetical protein
MPYFSKKFLFMTFRFYSFHWTQVKGKEILKQDNCYYYTSGPTEISDMKETVIRIFSLDQDAVILLQNITEISKEEYESLTGKPFIM